MAEILLNASETRLKLVSPATLVGTSVNYDTCRFSFGSEWLGYTKTAVFYTNRDKNAIPMLLDENGACTIPWEVLESPGLLYIGLFGVKGEIEIPTNFVILRITEGSAGNNVPPPPTLDVYAQILNQIAAIRAEEDSFVAAENIRKENENARQNNESVRQSTFTSNEDARQNTFDDNEAIRQNLFNATETIRQEKEAIRQTNEATREENEATRQQRIAELEQVNAVQFDSRLKTTEAQLKDLANQTNTQHTTILEYLPSDPDNPTVGRMWLSTYLINADFAGALGALPDNTLFNTYIVGGGTVLLNGNGQCECKSLTANDADILIVKKPISKETKTRIIKFKLNSGVSGSVRIEVLYDTPITAINGSLKECFNMIITSAGGFQTNYKNASNVNTSLGNYVGSIDTYYNFVLETTSTQYRMILRDATNTITLLTTNWVNWSDTYGSSSPMYLVMGDVLNDYHFGTLLIDNYSEV